MNSFHDIDAIQRIAAVAERACFDMIFMAQTATADPVTSSCVSASEHAICSVERPG